MRRIILAATVFTGLCYLSSSVSPVRSRSWNVDDSLAVRIRGMIDAGRYREVFDQLPPLIADARERGDSLQLGRLLCAQGQSLLAIGPIEQAKQVLDHAARLSAANADTLTWLTALGVKAYALNEQGRFVEAIAILERQTHIARVAGDQLGAAFALLGTGYANLNLGHAEQARNAYEQAAAQFHAARSARWRLSALTGLGRSHMALGRHDLAQYTFNEVRTLARELGDVRNEADAINNIAVIEYDHGDLTVAAALFEQACQLKLTLPDPLAAVTTMSNVALLRTLVGDFESGATILEEARDLCRERGADHAYLASTTELGNLRLTQKRYGAAAALYREVLQSTQSEETTREAALGLARVLVWSDSLAAALDVVRSALIRTPDTAVGPLPRLILTESTILERMGRIDESLDIARELSEQTNGTYIHPYVCVQRARSEARSGRTEAALGSLRAAVASLEERRLATGSISWRELMAADIHPVIVDAASTILDTAPDLDMSQSLYDLLQRVKARTLLDRIAPPGRAVSIAVEPLSLARTREKCLRDDDLLLDFHVGAERTILFAVTNEQCRLVTLPGQRSSLADQIDLFCGVLGWPSRTLKEAPAIAGPQHAIGDSLLGNIADLLGGANRLIVCTDGFLSALPFGLLAPGAAGPLSARAGIVYIPIASMINLERPHQPARGTIVVTGADRTLAGAAEEARDLQRRFHDVRVVSGLQPALADSLTGKALIHVAAHVDVDDARPWHSGIRLEAATHPAGQGAAPATPTHLWASDVLELQLDGQLAVLAACRSGFGRMSSGQGVLGLSSAFMVAGVSTVVATLWRVDDQATRALMGHFYAALADGATVATALHRAKQETRSREATSQPYYWAGFVLVGDGDARVHLQRKRYNTLILLILAAGLVSAAGAILLRKRVAA